MAETSLPDGTTGTDTYTGAVWTVNGTGVTYNDGELTDDATATRMR